MRYTDGDSRLLSQVTGQLNDTKGPNPRAGLNLFFEPFRKRRGPNQWTIINNPYIATLIPALEANYFPYQGFNRFKILITRDDQGPYILHA